MGMIDELFTKKHAVGEVVADGIKGKKKNTKPDDNKAETERRNVDLNIKRAKK